MIKKRVIIDMDDVMADASQGILNIYNNHYDTAYKKEDFYGNTLWQTKVLTGYLEVRHQLFEPGFFRNLAVMDGAVEVIKTMHQKYEVFIVSAAMEFPNSLREKYDWLAEHFDFISWKNIVLCGDKSIVQGDIMIDDHEKNLISFQGEKLLFNAMHNQDLQGYTRVNNWKEIAKILELYHFTSK